MFILVLKSRATLPPRTVSIPRSGFCLFILATGPRRFRPLSGFNPSVGILFVHTVAGYKVGDIHGMFQSLGRDSVCSYQSADLPVTGLGIVSIPRSGFCLFIPVIASSSNVISLPFQSLGRDSVCSYLLAFKRKAIVPQVSIPRSGFCLFIPRCR